MAAEPYPVGSIAVLRFEFRKTADDSLESPVTVTTVVVKPDGTIAHPAASPVSTGIFEAEFPVDQAGDFWYHAAGSGGVTAVGRPRMFRGIAVPS